ncbi:MAG: hypothetical protein QME21_16555 [Anaerolineales bacterium]|jgi:hypothetical protein|nr:hypothetical protein [Anaerolineales bacterium]
MNEDAGTHTENQIQLAEDISIHIFTASAAMVGVCLTVIGILRVVLTVHQDESLIDDILALDALIFLISCLLSYFALRTRGARKMARLEHFADGIFIIGLFLMVVICGLIVYEVL